MKELTKIELKSMKSGHSAWKDACFSISIREAIFKNIDFSGTTFKMYDFAGAYYDTVSFYGATIEADYSDDAEFYECDFTGVFFNESAPAKAAFYRCTGVFDAGTDRRGYRFLGFISKKGVMIYAGCRKFTLNEAKAHWSIGNNANADAYRRVFMIEEWGKTQSPYVKRVKNVVAKPKPTKPIKKKTALQKARRKIK